MAIKNLDPSRYTLTVVGVQIQGFAADTFIKFSMEADQIMDEAGGQGDVVRIINRDQRATFEITLLPTSPSNDYLSGLLTNDLASIGGAGSVGASSLADLNGTTAVDAEESWVIKYADGELGSKIYNRVWKVRLAKARVNIGGNLV